jgi:hypothetical protein
MLLLHPPPPQPYMQLGLPVPLASPPLTASLPRILLRLPTPIPLSAPFKPAQFLAHGLIPLFQSLPYDRDTGNVYLSRSQYWLLYPTSKKYHEQVGALDLACALGRGNLFFQLLAESLIPALQQNFSVLPSMPVVAQRQISLVLMLGRSVECGSGYTTHRGVLNSVKPGGDGSGELVVLIFRVPEHLEISLRTAQLANGTAYCVELREDN